MWGGGVRRLTAFQRNALSGGVSLWRNRGLAELQSRRSTSSSTPASKERLVVSIEGNIGSGKSTLLEVVGDQLAGVELLAEPVDRWTDCNGVNLLQAFYDDPKKYSYCFQSFAFVSRLMAQQQPQKEAIRVMERSPLSDYCFAKNCLELGLMTEVEWAAYEEWWRYFIGVVPGRPMGVVYLRTEPEVCFKRVNRRNRTEESSVKLSYLELLHKQHEEWLPRQGTLDGCVQEQCKRHKLPYVVLDGDKEFENDADRQQELVASVSSLLQHIRDAKAPPG